MELLKHTTEWVKGEVYQGRIMIIIGLLLLTAGILIFRGNNELLRGMLIPMILITLILIGYGVMQNTVRPAHLVKVLNLIKENPKAAMDKEFNKSENDDRIYSMAKKIWPIGIILSIGLYFYFKSEYYKGMSIGLMGLFLFLMILDSTLHQRLEVYLQGLKNLPK